MELIHLHPLLIIWLAVVPNVLNALGDASNHLGIKGWGHFFNAISYFLFLFYGIVVAINSRIEPLAFFFESISMAVVAIACIRFSIFSYIWNIAVGVKLSYIGKSAIVDRVMRRFRMPAFGWLSVKIVLAAFGCFIIFNYFY